MSPSLLFGTSITTTLMMTAAAAREWGGQGITTSGAVLVAGGLGGVGGLGGSSKTVTRALLRTFSREYSLKSTLYRILSEEHSPYSVL